MLKVVILVCSLVIPAQDCTRETAASVVVMPDAAVGAALCGRSGQAYLAQSAQAAALRGMYLKLLCLRGM